MTFLRKKMIEGERRTNGISIRPVMRSDDNILRFLQHGMNELHFICREFKLHFPIFLMRAKVERVLTFTVRMLTFIVSIQNLAFSIVKNAPSSNSKL